MQRHHVAGRALSDVIQPLCLNCHAVVTTRQQRWPDGLTQQDALHRGYHELFDMAAELADRGWFDGD